MLFKLHIWNAVHEQSTWTVAALKNCYQVTTGIKLVCHRKAAWTGAHNSHTLASSSLWWGVVYISHFIGIFNDCHFVFANGNWLPVNVTCAGLFAKGRAHATCKLWKIICLRQTVVGLLKVVVIEHVVPLWDKVV